MQETCIQKQCLLQMFLWITVNWFHSVLGICKSNLLYDLQDASFRSSSSVSKWYGPSACKISGNASEIQYRAWCPNNSVSTEKKEYLQIDLGKIYFIKLIITKGLSTEAKGGLHLTPHYYIAYRRDEADKSWMYYKNYNGTSRIKGNFDAQTDHYVTMNPPFVARWIRIIPFSKERTTVCLKLDLIGCTANGLVEYKAPHGTLMQQQSFQSASADTRLLDTSYDSLKSRNDFVSSTDALRKLNPMISPTFTSDQLLEGGLGKLTDNEPMGDYTFDPLQTSIFVGWKRKSVTSTTDFIRLIFFFDDCYQFSEVRLLLASALGDDRALPSLLEVRVGKKYSEHDNLSTLLTSFKPPIAKTKENAQWFRINCSKRSQSKVQIKSNSTNTDYSNIGRVLELRIYFGGPWIVLAEVEFSNSKCTHIHSAINSKANENDRQVIPDEISNMHVETEPLILLSRSNIARDQNSLQPHAYALLVGACSFSVLCLVFFTFLVFQWQSRKRTGCMHPKKLALSLQNSSRAPLIDIKVESNLQSFVDKYSSEKNEPNAAEKCIFLRNKNRQSMQKSPTANCLLFPPRITSAHISSNAVDLSNSEITSYSNNPLLTQTERFADSANAYHPNAKQYQPSFDRLLHQQNIPPYYNVLSDSAVYTSLPDIESESSNQYQDTNEILFAHQQCNLSIRDACSSVSSDANEFLYCTQNLICTSSIPLYTYPSQLIYYPSSAIVTVSCDSETGQIEMTRAAFGGAGMRNKFIKQFTISTSLDSYREKDSVIDIPNRRELIKFPIYTVANGMTQSRTISSMQASDKLWQTNSNCEMMPLTFSGNESIAQNFVPTVRMSKRGCGKRL